MNARMDPVETAFLRYAFNTAPRTWPELAALENKRLGLSANGVAAAPHRRKRGKTAVQKNIELVRALLNGPLDTAELSAVISSAPNATRKRLYTLEFDGVVERAGTVSKPNNSFDGRGRVQTVVWRAAPTAADWLAEQGASE